MTDESWQAWQTEIGRQPWFDHPSSSHGVQPQPQPEPDLTFVPGTQAGHDSIPQTAQGKFSSGQVGLFLQLQL
jgi:hypothetical protein